MGEAKMNNDQQQVEAWRKQFESQFNSGNQRYPSGYYRSTHRESMWQGFLLAKRNQPVIDMTLGQVVELNDFDRGYNQAIHDACIRIEAAGYSYKVK